jgi:hypothetical protein
MPAGIIQRFGIEKSPWVEEIRDVGEPLNPRAADHVGIIGCDDGGR